MAYCELLLQVQYIIKFLYLNPSNYQKKSYKNQMIWIKFENKKIFFFLHRKYLNASIAYFDLKQYLKNIIWLWYFYMFLYIYKTNAIIF